MKKFKRVLLKLSGEALMGTEKFGHDKNTIDSICYDIKALYDAGYELCLVVGGGNICRGAKAVSMGIERATADYMGMLGTVINAIALQGKLENLGVYTRVQSAIPMMTICESYIRRKAVRHMEKGRVVIFASGTGNPFFTTDTAATLRATEMNCDLILKGTQVDGIYSADPQKDANATKYSHLSYKEVINNELSVMDTAAITLARENEIPIIIFNIHQRGSLLKVLKGEGEFSIIK